MGNPIFQYWSKKNNSSTIFLHFTPLFIFLKDFFLRKKINFFFAKSFWGFPLWPIWLGGGCSLGVENTARGESVLLAAARFRCLSAFLGDLGPFLGHFGRFPRHFGESPPGAGCAMRPPGSGRGGHPPPWNPYLSCVAIAKTWRLGAGSLSGQIVAPTDSTSSGR